MKVAREGIPIIIGFAVAATVISWLGVWFLGVWGWPITALMVALVVWCVWFFRDPERRTPSEPGAVICPADGVVCAIGQADAPADLGLGGDGPFDRVCVFMNVFNVHVNRIPCDGVIEKTSYTKGKFINASLDKASVDNERMAAAMRTRSGQKVIFVQIAGLVARRIVYHLAPGQEVRAGERFGLIRFGSRVDVYMPRGSSIGVSLGQKTVAGETILARLPVPGAVSAPGGREVPVGR